MGYKDEYKNSIHLGEVKERREFEVKVSKVFKHETDFGVTHIVHMITIGESAGNYLVWFASNGGLQDDFEGKIKATVKDHTEYQGTKQTIVNRVTPTMESKND